MKILQVNNVYGEKSTGKITKVLHEGFIKSGHESVVVFGRGTAGEEKNVIRLCPEWYGKINALFSRITGIPYGGCFLSTLRLEKIIDREKPDIVHLQCINGNFVNIYKIIGWLKKKRIKTVVSLHAEFMYTANCGHAFECDQWKHGCKNCPDKKKAVKSWFFDNTEKSWNMMKNAFEGFESCVICPVSPWTESRARESKILENKEFETVLNGIDSEIFCFAQDAQTEENSILHVTAHFGSGKNDPKGGRYIIELAKRIPEAKFIVAGNAEEVQNLPENIFLLGNVEKQEELAKLYRKAKISILVSKKETFGMPVAESLCCGTPVVGFKAGAPEQIAIDEYSEFVEQGNIDELESAIRNWIKKYISEDEIASAAKEKYSAETMIRKFLEVYGRILWNFE